MKSQRYYEPNQADTIWENFGNEVVLINLKTGIYYSLADTALAIWKHVEKKTCLDDIILGFVKLDRADRARIETEIMKFIAELENEALIVPLEKTAQDEEIGIGAHQSRDLPDSRPFQAPILRKYTDQQELLLLDPIHEVSDLGWPEKNPDSPDAE